MHDHGPENVFWDGHPGGRSAGPSGLADRILHLLARTDKRVLAGFAAAVVVGLLAQPLLSPERASLPIQTAVSDASVSVSTLPPLPPLRLESSAGDSEASQLELFGRMSAAELDDLRRRPSKDRFLDVGCGDPVEISPPAGDLRDIVAAAEPGTCFRLGAGTYSFSDVRPKDYMTFIGSGREEVIVQGSSDTENAFSGTATGVNIGRMSIVGFQGSAGEKRQEQAAIRGTEAVWLSDLGEQATDWLIDDVAVQDNYATGVLLGDYFTVRNSLFSGNGVAGLSGNEFRGGLIVDNEVVGNGFSSEEQAHLANGGGMKFFQVGSPDEPLVVARNEVHANSKIGIWCDIGCDGFYVIDNLVYDYGGTGIVYEISSNAWIIGNHVTQSDSKDRRDWDDTVAGITVRESANVVVEDNFIDGAHVGVNVKQSKRPSLPLEDFLFRYENVTYVTSNITVRDNRVSNVRVMGVDVSDSGEGIGRLDTVRFIDNVYDDGNEMVFRWDGQRRLSFEQWRESNRDVGPQNGVGEPPSWPPPPREIDAVAE